MMLKYLSLLFITKMVELYYSFSIRVLNQETIISKCLSCFGECAFIFKGIYYLFSLLKEKKRKKEEEKGIRNQKQNQKRKKLKEEEEMFHFY